MCSIENLFTNKLNMMMSLQIYNTLSFALLCREKKGKFSDIENEFRIIAYDCPRIIKKKMEQMPREIVISGKIGVRYNGTLKAGEDTVFTSNLYTLNNTKKRLSTIIEEEQGKIISGECVKQKLIMVELRQTMRKLTEMEEADEEDDQYVFMWGVSI